MVLKRNERKEKEMRMAFTGELECWGIFLIVYNWGNHKIDNFHEKPKKCHNAPAIFKPPPLDTRRSYKEIT